MKASGAADQAAKFRLADQLKLEVTDAAPLDGANLYTDLLNAALSEVNWHEIRREHADRFSADDRGRGNHDFHNL